VNEGMTVRDGVTSA